MKIIGKVSVILSIASIVMVLLFTFLSEVDTDGWALIFNGVAVYFMLFASLFTMFSALVLGIVGYVLASKKKEALKLHLFSIISMSLLLLVRIYLTYF